MIAALLAKASCRLAGHVPYRRVMSSGAFEAAVDLVSDQFHCRRCGEALDDSEVPPVILRNSLALQPRALKNGPRKP